MNANIPKNVTVIYYTIRGKVGIVTQNTFEKNVDKSVKNYDYKSSSISIMRILKSNNTLATNVTSGIKIPEFRINFNRLSLKFISLPV